MNSLAIADKILGIIADKNKVVERASIFDVLDNIRGAKILSVVAATVPEVTGGQSSRFYNRVMRLSNPTIQINYDYENAVNKQLDKNGQEQDFVGGSTWYTVDTDEKGRLTPWARHKKTNELYLRYRLIQNNKSMYIDPISGKEIPFIDIEPYLRSNKSKTGVEVRVMKLENVKAIALDNKIFVTV